MADHLIKKVVDLTNKDEISVDLRRRRRTGKTFCVSFIEIASRNNGIGGGIAIGTLH